MILSFLYTTVKIIDLLLFNGKPLSIFFMINQRGFFFLYHQEFLPSGKRKGDNDEYCVHS